ncbi:hypothetical protein ABI59_21605 [Acidobacteria bacterium Mor1]|nr:hypothetical protein ABI59_21605 [Acidobacteria bacterium Mor1]
MGSDLRRIELLELLDRLLQSWWTVVAGVALGLAGGLIALNQTPAVYEAATSVLVVTSGLPAAAEDRNIERELPLRVATLEESVVRGAPDVAALLDHAEFRFARSVFEVRYRNGAAAAARDGADRIARAYVVAQAEEAGRHARERIRVLEQIAERLRKELDVREQRIAEFRSGQMGYSEEEQGRQLDAARVELAGVVASLEAKQQILESMIRADDVTPTPQSRTRGEFSEAAPPESPEVAALQQELEQLRERYVDGHPDIQALLRRIERAKRRHVEQLQAGEAGSKPERIRLTDSMINMTRGNDRLEDRRMGLEREIMALKKRIEGLRGDIAEHQRALAHGPERQRRLGELSEGVRVMRLQYEQHLARLEQERNAQLILDEEQGTRFEVLAAAPLPDAPIHPSVSLYLGGGVLCGLLLFVGPLSLRELWRPIVRSSRGLALLDDLPVLTSIPRVNTPSTLRRLCHLRNFSLSTAAILLLAAVVKLQ